MIWQFHSGYLAKGNEISLWKRYLHPHIHCSIIHNRRDVKTTCQWINMVYTHNGILATKRNPAICGGYYAK